MDESAAELRRLHNEILVYHDDRLKLSNEVDRLKAAQPAFVQEWMKPHPKCDEGCLFQCTKGFTQFPECATTPPTQPAPVQQEREILRAAQSEAVMPLIGPLLDAWERGLDFLNEYPELDKQLRRINRAMENAAPPIVATPLAAQPSSVQPSMPKKIDEVTRSDGSLKYSPNFAAGWNAAIDAMATPPAQRQWVGLTRAECLQIEKDMAKYYDYQHECKTVCLPEFAKAIEAKLRSKNT